MEINSFNIYLLIFLISITTYIPRSFPITYLANKDLPTWFKEWMKFIPASIFAALICPGLFTHDKGIYLSIDNIELIAAIIVLLISLKKKSLGLSIIVGVVSLYILSLF